MANVIEIVAPIPGLVTSITVAAGASVAAGDPIAVLQAMKMEVPVVAEETGTVEAVLVAADQEVDVGAVLVRLRVT